MEALMAELKEQIQQVALGFQDGKIYVWQVMPKGCKPDNAACRRFKPVVKSLTLKQAAEFELQHPEFQLYILQ